MKNSKKSVETESLTQEIETEKLFKHWFQLLQLIEDKFLKSGSPELSFQIVYLLFPLIESISFSLFNKAPRYYLKQLNISHPDLVLTMFRNGHMHNLMAHKLEYNDGEIGWGISSSSSSIVRPYDPGFNKKDFPERFREPEKEFEYFIFESNLFVIV